MSPKRSGLAVAVSDFAPGLLAIQESPPARLPRAVLYCVASLIAGLILWATLGQLDIIASADGRLVPKTFIKIVQPADAGVVKEILVREGQRVAVGQVLVRMDPQDDAADLRTLQTQFELRSLQLRRIDAELTGARLRSEPQDAPDLFAKVLAQYRDRRQSYLDSMAQVQELRSKAEHDYRAGLAVLAKLQQTNPILRSQAQAYADLGKDGYAPQVLVGDKQRAYVENSQDLEAQRSSVAGLEAALAQADKQLSEVTSKYRSDLQNERVDAEADYRKLSNDLAKQTHRTEQLELRAPAAGVVKDLATHTIGTVVAAGTTLLSLVPDHVPLVAEVMIRNDDIGFVRVNQAVKVKLAAYPFQKYGMLDGRVLQVWPDAMDPASNSRSSSGDSESTASTTAAPGFRALIALNRQDMRAQGQTLSLTAGMEIMAEIREGRRSVLEYVLSPIQRTLSESGHER